MKTGSPRRRRGSDPRVESTRQTGAVAARILLCLPMRTLLAPLSTRGRAAILLAALIAVSMPLWIPRLADRLPGQGTPCAATGFFVGSQAPHDVRSLATQLGVTAHVMNVYAYGPGFNYYSDPPQTSIQLLLGVGAVTPSQARAIGRLLVATGHANTIIRIMWEMNGNWFPWGTQALSARRYIAIYRDAYRAFTSVRGNRFQFVWNVNAGTAEPGRTEFDTYPGDAYVSNIGFDFYAYNPATQTGARPSVVAPVLAFAARHGKPVSIDEWGLNGIDDPSYVNFVSRIVHRRANNVQFQSYFSDRLSNIDLYPAAMAAYRTDFARAC